MKNLFLEDISSEELIVDEAACSTDDFIFNNKNWKAKLNLENGKISYFELTEFPKNCRL